MKSCVKRAIFALSFFLLTSCSEEACRQWDICEIVVNNPTFNSCRLILVSDSHLEVELDRSQTGIRMYVNLLLLQAPPLPNESNRTFLNIDLDNGETMAIFPYLLAGGQRLLFPPDVADFFIQMLLEGRSFTIRLGRQKIEVVPDQFEAHYQRLMEIPIHAI